MSGADSSRDRERASIQPITMEATMPPPNIAHVHAMRFRAFDADAVSCTETPLGDEARAVMVCPGNTLLLVTRLASGTLMR